MWKPRFAFFFCPLLQSSPGPLLLLLLPCTLYIFNEKPPPPLLSPLAYFPQRCLTTSTLNSSVWEQFPERNTLPPSRQHVVLQRRFTEDSSPECDDTETRGEFRQSPGSGGRATPICERCVDHGPKTTGKLNAFFFLFR